MTRSRPIATATGNRYFVEVLNHLGLAVLPRTRVDLRYMVPGDTAFDYLRRSNEEHWEIYRAIVRRDAQDSTVADFLKAAKPGPLRGKARVVNEAGRFLVIDAEVTSPDEATIFARSSAGRKLSRFRSRSRSLASSI